MFRKLCIIGLAFLMSLSVMTLTADAQNKVTGPWMWIITEDSAGCGAAATHVDEIDEQTGGKLTEEDVAKNGITPKVLRVKFKNNLKWTEGEITAAGGNNLNEAVTKIGLGAGDIQNHCAYAVINARSKKSVNGATARVGSDDSVKVWVNGKNVHANAVNRGAQDFQDTFNVDIKRGDNVIMVKVCECGGGWSMFFGTTQWAKIKNIR